MTLKIIYLYFISNRPIPCQKILADDRPKSGNSRLSSRNVFKSYKSLSPIVPPSFLLPFFCSLRDSLYFLISHTILYLSSSECISLNPFVSFVSSFLIFFLQRVPVFPPSKKYFPYPPLTLLNPIFPSFFSFLSSHHLSHSLISSV